MLTRRELLGGIAASAAAQSRDRLNLWTFSDAHVGTDKRHGRESLVESIEHSESDFEWDLALDMGDTRLHATVPAGTHVNRDEVVRFGWKPERVLSFDPETGRNLAL